MANNKNKGIGKVGYRLGHVIDRDSGDSFGSQQDAWKKDADCGCGIDCCEGEMILTDKTTRLTWAFFMDNGVFKLREQDGTLHTVTVVAD